MTLAVIKTGGKQYLVREGDTLKIEKLEGEAGKIEFAEVLMVDDGTTLQLGTPLLDKMVVEGELVKTFKDDKVMVFKMKRRKRYRRMKGHRQQQTLVKITKIG